MEQDLTVEGYRHPDSVRQRLPADPGESRHVGECVESMQPILDSTGERAGRMVDGH